MRFFHDCRKGPLGEGAAAHEKKGAFHQETPLSMQVARGGGKGHLLRYMVLRRAPMVSKAPWSCVLLSALTKYW
jgi:hypothetical protein